MQITIQLLSGDQFTIEHSYNCGYFIYKDVWDQMPVDIKPLTPYFLHLFLHGKKISYQRYEKPVVAQGDLLYLIVDPNEYHCNIIKDEDEESKVQYFSTHPHIIYDVYYIFVYNRDQKVQQQTIYSPQDHTDNTQRIFYNQQQLCEDEIVWNDMSCHIRPINGTFQDILPFTNIEEAFITIPNIPDDEIADLREHIAQLWEEM